MKKFSPPEMKEVFFPTPHTPHPTPHTPLATFLSALVMIVIGFFNRINKNAPKKEAFFNLS
jgi:hypothetical protein